MKKLAFTTFAIVVAIANSFAAYLVDLSAYNFYKSDTSVVQEGSFAVIAYDSSVDISSLILNIGDSFNASTWFDSSASGIFVLNVASFDDSYPFTSFSVDNESLPITGNESIAIITWVQPTGKSYLDTDMVAGTEYSIVSPNIIPGNPLSGGDIWQLLPGNTGALQLYLETSGAGGSVADSYTTLSNVVVPEPAELATVFGVAALALAAYRRRK